VFEQCINGLAIALHDIEHAIRQSRLAQQLGQQQADRGIALGGLQHEGIAADQRQRKHPHRHHGWKIERRDAGHHAQWLAQVPVVDAPTHVVRVCARQQPRRAAGEFNDFDAARDFAVGIGKNLAVLARDGRGELRTTGFQQITECEHHPRTPQRGSRRPRRRGRHCRSHSGVDGTAVGKRNLRDDLAGSGIEDITATACAGRIVGAAAEVMPDAHHGSGCAMR
jgi:hypothetical protein